MKIWKIGMGLAAATAMFSVAMLSGCGIGGAPQSSFTLTQPDVGTFNVELDVTHGYIMDNEGIFSTGGKKVAGMNFISAEELAQDKEEAKAKDGYKRIEINGQQGVYFEDVDQKGNTVCYYIVSIKGSDAGLVVAGPEESNVADALNLITVEPA